MASPIAVVTCPACKEDLSFDGHPVHDWKRGTVQLEIFLTEDSLRHLASHGGASPQDSTDLSADAVSTGDEVAQPATQEQTPEQATEVTPESVDKPVSTVKKGTKTP